MIATFPSFMVTQEGSDVCAYKMITVLRAEEGERVMLKAPTKHLVWPLGSKPTRAEGFVFLFTVGCPATGTASGA